MNMENKMIDPNIMIDPNVIQMLQDINTNVNKSTNVIITMLFIIFVWIIIK